MYKLEIYKVIDGKDDWPLVDIVWGLTEKDCLNKASFLYNQDEYHWTNPYQDDSDND